MPMVMLTGQKPIKTSKQGQFQLVDVIDMMQPLTKFSRRIDSGDRIPSCVREAFRRAQEERPGASHLELPEDIAREITQAPVIDPSFTRRPVAEDKAIHRAVTLIANANHPLLLIGAGANRKRPCRMLRDFIDRTGIPFVTTQMGKGVISEDSPHFLGNAALSTDDFVHRALDAADVIINVGHDVVEKPPFFMQPGGRTVIHVNFTSAEVDPVYFPQVEVVGDIANSIWRMGEAMPEKLVFDTSFFNTVRTALDEHIREHAGSTDFPVSPRRLVADIRQIMPDDGIIALDNGMYKIWFARNYPAYLPNTVLLDNALASMGAGLPSAMVAKMVHPDRRVMAICGDGGFMMNSQELRTAVQLGLDLVVLVLRDDAYGMIKWKQKDMGFEDFGLDFTNPDFVTYAQAHGASGNRVESVDQLSTVVQQAFAAKGVQLIDVPIDYAADDQILNHEIKELSAML
jgi:acetolactate synthase-1/2/3 large subunit